jgi:hypothetical protein
MASALHQSLIAAILEGMKFRIIVEPDEDGVFVAECPTLPGCISQGATRNEAMTNILPRQG